MFTVYSKPSCTFCNQAKQLLTSMKLEYKEIEIDVGQTKVLGKTYVPASELKEKVPTARTVPQIFDGETYIGGFTELRTHLMGTVTQSPA
jgi:glutaredoxin 3